MLFVYYRNEAGVITNCHKAPEGMEKDALEKAVIAHNFDQNNRLTAYIAETDPDLIEYLLGKKHQRYEAARSAIREAIESIENAESEIRSLEGLLD